jgi:hypothetical protein
MSEIFRSAYEIIKAERPEIVRLVYPRRIIPPQGYPNPAGNAVILSAHLAFNNPNADSLNKTMIDCLLCTWKLCELGSPIYFVGRDFATALTMTDAPDESLKISDLKWPHDAMTFVLPEDFARAYFGRTVPFIRVARQPVGMLEAPECVTRVAHQWRQVGIESQSLGGEMAFITSMTVMYRSTGGNDFPVDFASSFSTLETVGSIMTKHEFIHDQDRAETMFFQWDNFQKIKSVISETDNTTPEEDVELSKRMISLAIHLLMAMSALPQHIEIGKLARPQRIKHGRVEKEALWHPNFFGGAYVLNRPKSPAEGTHASPRLHRRRGHWRTKQRYGPNNSLVKVIWIEPTWIGAEAD